jgi:hypothetical protein
VSISQQRFQWALTSLEGAQWRSFERLALAFLADEYSSLRPTASESGDAGADGLIFRPEDDPTVLVQVSVRRDVPAKIAETCKRIKATFPEAKVLVYLTNQVVGADSTKIRRRIRETYRIHVDIRDREWFIANRNASTATSAEAEELARMVVDPVLANSGEAIHRHGQALEDLEAKAAFVYLGLQWEDDNREKGLTKVCFEAIVRSVLRDTTGENRMARARVSQLVHDLLPAHNEQILSAQVDGALKRLSKRYIRHWQKVDEFCLTWDERVRLAERLTAIASLDEALATELRRKLSISATEASGTVTDRELDKLVGFSRKVIERVLLDRGEAFASTVTHEKGEDVLYTDVEAVVDKVLVGSGVVSPLPIHVLAATIQSLLIDPADEVRQYLRSLADTYTLFAFMRETPDVQSAVVKIFADADLWPDTSVVLPLLAEELLDEHSRAHTQLLSAARECGLRLYITDGVLEELVTHIGRSLSFATAVDRDGGARGEPPFLFASYKLAGRDVGTFARWIENFCGTDADADLLDYLEEEHGIELQSLRDLAERASIELRAAVAEVWHEARDARDRRNEALGLPAMDSGTRAKLIGHDVENYLGVIMRREERGERRSAFGYRSWWLTLDGNAFRVAKKLKGAVAEKVPPSPAMSPDFMLNYLSIGPVRSRLSRRSEDALPLMLNMSIMDAVPPDLIELADVLRSQLQGLQPRVVRRKIRETLEDARRLLGPTAEAGERGLNDEIRRRLIAQALVR